MWSHCFRKKSGINTNMAIESLNKVLKRNKLHSNENIRYSNNVYCLVTLFHYKINNVHWRIEKLLDTLEDLVDETLWKRVLNIERPTGNHYQYRNIIRAHNKAEKMKNIEVQEPELGTFLVSSSSQTGKFSKVSVNHICDLECRNAYCKICKICVHSYECDCAEYTIKSTLCKHIHFVSLFESRRSDFVAGNSEDAGLDLENTNEIEFVAEPSGKKMKFQEEINHFVLVKKNRPSITSFDEPEYRKVFFVIIFYI